MFFFFNKNQTGFSLLELVTVLLIITVLSTIAIRSTVEIGYSARYEQTRDMADKIKKSIIGHPGELVNGQPDISGYVADIGRTPEFLRDLLQPGFCKTTADVYVIHTSDALCIGPNLWVWPQHTNCLQKSDVTVDTGFTTKATCIPEATYVWLGVNFDSVTTSLRYGWDGPYIHTSDSATDQLALRDGWANIPGQADNYGWVVAAATTVGDDFSIESLGKDQAPGPNDDCYASASDGYSEDCITIITQIEYTKNVSTLSITINTDKTTLSPYIDPTEIGFCTDTDNTIVDPSICNSTSNRDWDSITSKCLVTFDSIVEASCNTSTKRWNSTLDVCTNILNLETQSNCINVSLHNWDVLVTPSSPPVYPDLNVCARIYYRVDGEIISTPLTSTSPNLINRNGSSQDTSFTFAATDIPIGINAIGIYEANDNATPLDLGDDHCAVISTIYPINHAIQQVTFAPYKTIDNIGW